MKLLSTDQKLKWASVLIVAGLIIAALSLTRVHPLAFVAFLMAGCPLVAAGTILYLVSIVSSENAK